MKILKTSLRIIPIVLFVLTLTTSSRAQLSIGFRGGVNFATINSNDPIQEYKAKTAPGFSLLFNYAISPSLDFQVEPGYAQWSAQISDTQTAPNYIRAYTYRIFLDYIEVPMLIQYKPHLGKLQAIFSFGPEARFPAKPMKAKTKVTQYYNGQITDQLEREDRYTGDRGIKKFDVGLVAGAGILYPIGAFQIIAEGRYHYGLTNIYGNLNTNSFATYVRGISAHAGILFPLGKK
jgi:hypothetical protein